MSSLEVLTGRKHMSHSSLSTWLDCGERFYLERVAGAPQSKAWYLIGGSAFHTATEWLDRGEMGDPTAAFLLAWNQQCGKELVGVDIATVRAGGKATKEWPNKEDQAWWLHHGPIMVAQYVAWRDARLAEGWQFFTFDDSYGTTPHSAYDYHFDYSGVYLPLTYYVGAFEADVLRAYLYQKWSDKWVTYQRYGQFDNSPEGYARDGGLTGSFDITNWTFGVQYWYTPTVMFELAYDDVDYDEGWTDVDADLKDDSLIRLRTHIFF